MRQGRGRPTLVRGAPSPLRHCAARDKAQLQQHWEASRQASRGGFQGALAHLVSLRFQTKS